MGTDDLVEVGGEVGEWLPESERGNSSEDDKQRMLFLLLDSLVHKGWIRCPSLCTMLRYSAFISRNSVELL